MTTSRYEKHRPAAQRLLALALVEVLVTAENAEPELPQICDWTLDSNDTRHGDVPAVAGQRECSGSQETAVLRAAIAEWAQRMGGDVVEVPSTTWITVEARFYVDDVLVYVWDMLHADGKCPRCGHPAVGDQCLKSSEAEPCVALALAPVTAAAIVSNSRGWSVAFRQNGVRGSLPMESREAAQQWVVENAPVAVPA